MYRFVLSYECLISFCDVVLFLYNFRNGFSFFIYSKHMHKYKNWASARTRRFTCTRISSRVRIGSDMEDAGTNSVLPVNN